MEVTPPAFRQIFSQFQDVAKAEGKLPPTKHTLHHIKTTGPPATARFRRLDAAKLAVAKSDFAKLERDGIIRRSSSTWSAPLHMVMKPDGTWRPCGDYRRLNCIPKALFHRPTYIHTNSLFHHRQFSPFLHKNRTLTALYTFLLISVPPSDFIEDVELWLAQAPYL